MRSITTSCSGNDNILVVWRDSTNDREFRIATKRFSQKLGQAGTPIWYIFRYPVITSYEGVYQVPTPVQDSVKQHGNV